MSVTRSSFSPLISALFNIGHYLINFMIDISADRVHIFAIDCRASGGESEAFQCGAKSFN